MAASDTQQAVTAPPPPVPAAPAPVVEPVVTVTSSPGDPTRTHFTATDANSDGAIDPAEAAADTGLAAAFGDYDKDGDGRLSMAEYKRWRDER
jgi:Ca2+-binding EF-hand superfamily protein